MDTSKLTLLKTTISNDIANDELGMVNKHALLRGQAGIIESYLTQKARKIARAQGATDTNEGMLSTYKSFLAQFVSQSELPKELSQVPAIYLEQMSSLIGFKAGKAWYSL
ncbi:hypothetical protein [Vibrio sp. B1Z05]|uniref:hypothetical protein n=1 Tax=Vibrio sp. B1Z05 TaxID=2654980 RepID=UPI00128D2F06|nr:hypothetical protein [Vibrio sp. B1Z05]MPW35850.1 hypothetical protein [Vibrio sp. B1Z05]